MKKITLLILSAGILAHANLTVKQIENMVVKIHQKRPGLDLSKLDKTFEPFALKNVVYDTNQTTGVKTVKKKAEARIELHAIMSDKAFLNDRWLKVNDTINGYTLKHIGKRGVVLQSGDNIKKLMFHKNKNSLIKIEGR